MHDHATRVSATRPPSTDGDEGGEPCRDPEHHRLRVKEAATHRLLMAATLLARQESLVSGDLLAAFQDITRMAARSIEVQRVSIWFFGQTRRSLTCVCIFDGREGLFAEGARLTATQYPAYFAEIERGRVVAAEDALQDPRTCEFGEGYLKPMSIAAMLDVPIKVGDRLAGVVCFEHTGVSRVWSPEEQQFAGFASSLVSLAMVVSERLHQTGPSS